MTNNEPTITQNCPGCGVKQEFVPQYLRYFQEYQDMEPRATLVCPECGQSVDIKKTLRKVKND